MAQQGGALYIPVKFLRHAFAVPSLATDSFAEAVSHIKAGSGVVKVRAPPL